MRIAQFEMERWQSHWENVVECNLSESGVSPATLQDFLDEEEIEQLRLLKLGYPQTNGTVELRRRIAALYPGASEDNVLVTSGTAEANLLATLLLVQKEDEVVCMMPNYMQIWGLVGSCGGHIRPFWLKEADCWQPDLEEFERVISPRTALLAICNPNNPTGSVLAPDTCEYLLKRAEQIDSWVLSDEVYRGAELDGGPMTPSLWGRYPKTVATGGLSKAYGLPGLRIGWLVGDPDLIEQAWSWKDYTTIAPSVTSDFLARAALAENRRKRLLQRTHRILSENYPLVRGWVDSQPEFSLVDPQAGAIAYTRYQSEVPSDQLVLELRRRQSLLLVSGAHFQMGSYLRVGFGYDRETLVEGLARVSEGLRSF